MLDRLCARVAAGETVYGVCRDADMPSMESVMRMQASCDEVRRGLGRAREQGAHALADLSVVVTFDADVDSVQLAKVRSKALQWLASKHGRAVYGEHVQHQVDGGIDLRAALGAAQQRLDSRPIRDITPIASAQVLDKPKESLTNAQDIETIGDAIVTRKYESRGDGARVNRRRMRQQRRNHRAMTAAAAKLDAAADDDGIPW